MLHTHNIDARNLDITDLRDTILNNAAVALIIVLQYILV